MVEEQAQEKIEYENGANRDDTGSHRCPSHTPSLRLVVQATMATVDGDDGSEAGRLEQPGQQPGSRLCKPGSIKRSN
jgi:hypothetical protein